MRVLWLAALLVWVVVGGVCVRVVAGSRWFAGRIVIPIDARASSWAEGVRARVVARCRWFAGRATSAICDLGAWCVRVGGGCDLQRRCRVDARWASCRIIICHVASRCVLSYRV